MKVLTVRQPWASLIVAGIKTIETRPAPPNGPMRPAGVRGLPGLPIEPGERIGIHAAAARPALGMVGEWLVRWRWGECSIQRHVPGESGYQTIWLPLGALIGTVEVVRALPIDNDEPVDHDYPDPDWINTAPTEPIDLALYHSFDMVDTPGVRIETHEHDDISDQLPLGDFTPGRWAWILAEPEPCDPQPMRGRQGVWRWDP